MIELIFGRLLLNEDKIFNKILIVVQLYSFLLVLYLFHPFSKTEQLMKNNVKNVRYPYLVLAQSVGVSRNLLFGRKKHFVQNQRTIRVWLTIFGVHSNVICQHNKHKFFGLWKVLLHIFNKLASLRLGINLKLYKFVNNGIWYEIT